MESLILVTGGTGFVGSEVVKQLAGAGYRVRLLARNPRKAIEFARKYGAEIAPGDVTRPETLPSALRGVGVVIHLVGIIQESRHATFEAVHAEGTRHLVEAARTAGVKRFIFMSALGTRANSRSRYHQTKWEAEEAVRGSGLDYTIFRPSVIYGPNDHAISLFAGIFQWPSDFLLGYGFPDFGGKTLLQPIFVTEVARCFVRSLSTPLSLGRTYDLCGPEPIAWQELFGTVAGLQGCSYVFETLPFRYFARCLLWTAAGAIPLLFLLRELIPGGPPLVWTDFAAGLAVWVAVLWLAVAWRKWIFYRVPIAPVRVVARWLDPILPRSCRGAEQLMMLEEDNIGDGEPAARDFQFQPRSLAEGLSSYLPK